MPGKGLNEPLRGIGDACVGLLSLRSILREADLSE